MAGGCWVLLVGDVSPAVVLLTRLVPWGLQSGGWVPPKQANEVTKWSRFPY